MIQELTKENLQSLGFNENEVNKLYSTTENYTYQSNNGNIFVSKTENKIYTGIDFYRITYFENGNLRFPYNCPDLVNEYFDLALNEFLQKQKSILGLLYNETDQFNKFILLETKQSELIIKEQKDYIELYDKRQWHNKEKIINILESYINFLKLKQQPKAVKPNEKYKNENLFKVGELFATGEMNKYFTLNGKNKTVMKEGYSAPKIAKELGNPSFEKNILASINNYTPDKENGNKNIFNNLDMMTKIIADCKAKNKPVEPYFMARLPIE